MTNSPSGRAEARFKQLCCLGLGGHAVIPALLDELRLIVPNYGSSFFFLDKAGALANIYDPNPETPHVAPLYLQEFYNRPERELGCGFADGLRQRFGVQGYNEVLTVDLGTFYRSDYYNLILRQLGYADIIRLAIWNGGLAVGGIMLARAPGERPFSEQDRRRLASLETFFAHALSTEKKVDSPFVDSGRQGLIVADSEGRPVYASVEGRRLLFLAANSRAGPVGVSRGQSVLPPAIVGICRSLAGIFSDQTMASAPAYHHHNAWGGFIFRCHWLDRADASSGLIGITITHEEPLPVKLTRSVARMPLSIRQAEICVLMAGGATHEIIAERLGISLHTVITHGRVIYHRLGVHSRAELLSKVLAA